jgi:hypothetical protein
MEAEDRLAKTAEHVQFRLEPKTLLLYRRESGAENQPKAEPATRISESTWYLCAFLFSSRVKRKIRIAKSETNSTKPNSESENKHIVAVIFSQKATEETETIKTSLLSPFQPEADPSFGGTSCKKLFCQFSSAKPSSSHRLPKLHQRLIENVHADQPDARVLEVENDVNRNRYDEREADYVKPTARLISSHGVA